MEITVHRECPIQNYPGSEKLKDVGWIRAAWAEDGFVVTPISLELLDKPEALEFAKNRTRAFAELEMGRENN